jgi:Sulfotransferase family
MSTDAARVPDFFIVGHPKSGTTALYEMLRAHPQVFMPALKEPRFLAGDMYVHSDDSTELPSTTEEYLALFAQADTGQLAGEASPLYLASGEAAGRIAELQPQARIIAVLREPASFLRSLHLQFVQSHIENENDLAQAIALESTRREGKQIPPASRLRPQVLQYAEHVRYVEQLRRYHDLFPAERVLVLIYDDFRGDNEQTVKKVLRFLEIDDAAPIEASEANPTVRVRSQQLDRLLRSVSMGRSPATRAVKGAVKTLTPRRLRRQALRVTRSRVVYGRPQPPDEETILELRGRFKGEVAALSDYLGRDLVTLWGYADV